MIKEAIAAAAAGRELSSEVMEGAMEVLFRGEATPSQIGALLVALRMKGETVGEIAAAARVMRRHCLAVEVPGNLAVVLDTCGTGGDGALTFNISTAAAIVVAACGVPVAKHGNRAASSNTGSADVLEVLGVKVDLAPAQIARCLERCGIGFMFARLHHPAMKHVGPARSEIGVRTLFNFLGPLCNPAGATHQLIGVPEPRLCEPLARVLSELGAERAWVLCGHGGLDELSLSGASRVVQVHRGAIETLEVRPADFGIAEQASDTLRVKNAEESAAIIRAVLAGSAGAPRDVVIMNAAAALLVAGHAPSLRDAAVAAAAALDSGAARRKLEAWVSASQAA